MIIRTTAAYMLAEYQKQVLQWNGGLQEIS